MKNPVKDKPTKADLAKLDHKIAQLSAEEAHKEDLRFWIEVYQEKIDGTFRVGKGGDFEDFKIKENNLLEVNSRNDIRVDSYYVGFRIVRTKK